MLRGRPGVPASGTTTLSIWSSRARACSRSAGAPTRSCRETSESRPHSTSSSSQYVLNAIKYIQFNYSHDISIDDVAKSVGVSRSHLYRVFMLNVGKSPIDYLTEYRVNEACKLLRSGTLSIAEVAASVGFLDQFYFSRVFKRAKGVPPSKYMTSQADADVQPAPDET